jgi:tetratricopeptide (TPR) repeat protein
MERAKGSVRVGDHEEAIRLLKSYLARTPDSREAHLLLGTTLAKQGKFHEAGEEFNTLLVKNPHDLEALNNIAVTYRRQGKLQDVLATLIDAIDINPTRAEFHYNIGNIHKQLGNFSAASMAYAKVVELDPNFVPVYNNLGTAYEQLMDYEKAFLVFRKGLLIDRNNPTLHFNYGIALEAKSFLEEAANEYKLALRSKPGWLAPMNNLGIVLFKQDHHDKALHTFNRILKADPFNAEARNNMGVVLADMGNTKEAVQNYRMAIEADPKYIKAVVNLEQILENAGDFADALVELEKLVKLTPNSAEVRTKLAGLYIKMERYPEALEEVRAALQWEPENINALRIEGMVQRVLGNDEAAKVIFEHILSIDPLNFLFHLDLADIHFRRKEYKEAEERIKAYLLRQTNNRKAKLLLGRLYAEMGNRTHAIQVFEELARADPTDAEALAAAAELHKDGGAIEKALRTADTLVNLQGKRGTAEDLSELNKSLEFYESAVHAYSSSVREMWDRNIKLASAAAEADGDEANTSLLLGAAGIALSTDEETETLFIEDDEFLENEMIKDGNIALDEEVEEEYFPKEPDYSLDKIAESGNLIMPFGQHKPNTQPPDHPAGDNQAEQAVPAPQRQYPQPAPRHNPAPQNAAREEPPRRPVPPQTPEPEQAAPDKGDIQKNKEMVDENILAADDFAPEAAAEEEPEAAGEPAPEAAPDEAKPSERKKPATLTEAMIGLINYLQELTESLPDKEKYFFFHSDIRKKMDFIIINLGGRKPEHQITSNPVRRKLDRKDTETGNA